MIAARPCVLRFVSLTHTHTTLSLKGTGDRKGARAAGQAGNQHVDVHEKRTLRTGTRKSGRHAGHSGTASANEYCTDYGVCSRPDGLFSHDIPHPMRMMPTAPTGLYMSMSNCPCVSYHAIEPHHRAQLLRQRVLPDTGRSIFLRSASKTGGAPMRSSASGFSAPS